jgi:hypothetical protein
MTKKQKTLRRGVTPEMVEDSLSFLDTVTPVFDGIPAEDWEAYCLPVWADLFVEELKEGIPALDGDLPDHLDELLKPGNLTWTLWEALNPRFPAWNREKALAEIRKKIRTPLYWKRWKDLKGRIVPRLQEDHPELSTRAALELRTMQALFHASEKVLSLLHDKPMDPEGVLRRLKSTMGEEVPEEILGPGWREEEAPPAADDDGEEEDQPALDVLELHPLGEADTNQLADELFDRGGLTPLERKVFLIVWKERATDKEAAGILGISEGAARLRLHKARKKITKALGGM